MRNIWTTPNTNKTKVLIHKTMYELISLSFYLKLLFHSGSKSSFFTFIAQIIETRTILEQIIEDKRFPTSWRS